MNAYKFYLLNSDNFQDAYVTAVDYKEITLTMNSGDFGAHKAIGMNELPDGAQLTLIEPDECSGCGEYTQDCQCAPAPSKVRFGTFTW